MRCDVHPKELPILPGPTTSVALRDKKTKYWSEHPHSIKTNKPETRRRGKIKRQQPRTFVSAAPSWTPPCPCLLRRGGRQTGRVPPASARDLRQTPGTFFPRRYHHMFDKHERNRGVRNHEEKIPRKQRLSVLLRHHCPETIAARVVFRRFVEHVQMPRGLPPDNVHAHQSKKGVRKHMRMRVGS